MSIESPCINVCKLDESKTLCIGCFRTLDEISEWRLATEERQQQIVEAAKDRKNAHAGIKA